MSYSIRDLLGHFVKPRTARGKMCPHPCCRGKRVHPANFPLILPAKLLRQASDKDLAKHYERHADQPRAAGQIVREMERRDRRDRRAKDAVARRRSRTYEREQLVESRYAAALDYTRGHMLNARGRRANVRERDLISNRRLLERYGSTELRNYMAGRGLRG